MVGCHNDSGEPAVNFEDADVWLGGLRNFAGLTGALLLVGILANVYLLRLTEWSRFPVHWETGRLSLRYSSVIDVSLCFVFVPIMLCSWVNFHSGSDVSITLRCELFDVVQVSRLGFVPVGCGVVVLCRQMCMLYMFRHENPLIDQHGGRTVKLLRDVIIVGAVSVVSYLFLPKFAPDIHLHFCFVDGWMTSRNVYLFPLPVAVNIILGVVVLVRTSPPEVDVEQQDVKLTLNNIGGDLSDKAIDSLPLHDFENGFDKITHSRWNKFVIVTSESLLTWFVLVAALALAGILLQPPNVGTVFVLIAVSTLPGVWSACAVFRYWT